MVQIIGVEICHFFQRWKIMHGQPVLFECDKFHRPQLCQNPSDMRLRQPQRVGEMLVRQRQMAAVMFTQAYRAHPQIEFAEQVRERFDRVALSEADRPFALDRGADQSIPPQGAQYPRMRVADVFEIARRYPRNLERRNRANRMVHLVQDIDMQICEIAGQEESHDLAPAVIQIFIPAGPAAGNHIDLARIVTLADHVVAGFECFRPLLADFLQSLYRLRRQFFKNLQFADQILARHVPLFASQHAVVYIGKSDCASDDEIQSELRNLTEC